MRFGGGIDAHEKPGSPKVPEGEEGWQESMELVENLVPPGTVYLTLTIIRSRNVAVKARSEVYSDDL